jgi:hypothetical protein
MARRPIQLGDVAVTDASWKPIELPSFSFRQSAFPDHEHAPAGFPQCQFVACVALFGSPKLCFPPVGRVVWSRSKPAPLVLVPEAAVHENCQVVFWKYDVRRARQASGVNAKTKPCAVQVTSKQELRFRVLRSDGSHHPRPYTFGNYVDHFFCFMDCRGIVSNRIFTKLYAN